MPDSSHGDHAADPQPTATSDSSVEVSVPRLVDQARELIVAAWDRNELPEYLFVHPALHAAVLAAKPRETAGGRPVRLLGLQVVRSAHTPLDRPLVR